MSFLSCCLSRQGKEYPKESSMEMNQGIIKDKIDRKYDDNTENSDGETPSPDFGPKKSKYDQFVAAKQGNNSPNKLSASRGISTDDSLTGERYDNTAKTFSTRQWLKILKNNDLDNTSVNDLLNSLRFGVADELRPNIWEFLTKMSEFKQKFEKDYYKTLKNKPNASYDEQIKKDTSRTFPSHPYFKNDNAHGEQMMFNILRAYANHDPEIGYTQGMNYVVGKLLIIMEPENYCSSDLSYFDHYEQEYEEKTFWLFMYILTVKNCRQLYKNNFPKMHSMINNLDVKLQQCVPEIFNIIKNSHIDLVHCFYSMFICLLMDSTPTPVAKRLLDLFFIEGENVLFKVIVRAMLICKQDIIDASKDVAKLHNLLKHDLMVRAYKYNKNQIHVIFPGMDSMQ